MAIADVWKQRLLDKLLRGTDFTPPSTLYLSLHTADPGKTGASEAAGGSYARQAISFAAATSAGSKGGTVDIEIASMPAATITHYAIQSAVTGANVIQSGPLTSSVAVLAGQTLRLKASQLGIDIT